MKQMFYDCYVEEEQMKIFAGDEGFEVELQKVGQPISGACGAVVELYDEYIFQIATIVFHTKPRHIFLDAENRETLICTYSPEEKYLLAVQLSDEEKYIANNYMKTVDKGVAV